SMDELVKELAKDSSAAQRRWIVAVGAGIALFAIAGAAGQYIQQRHELCRGAERKLSTAWTPPMRADLRRAFEVTGSPLAFEVAGRVADQLDAYAASWAQM